MTGGTTERFDERASDAAEDLRTAHLRVAVTVAELDLDDADMWATAGAVVAGLAGQSNRTTAVLTGALAFGAANRPGGESFLGVSAVCSAPSTRTRTGWPTGRFGPRLRRGPRTASWPVAAGPERRAGAATAAPIPREGLGVKILLMVSALNGLSQRVLCAIERAGHDTAVHIAESGADMRDAVLSRQPDLILCPFLKAKVPQDVWQRWLTIIIHPGPVGDRGHLAGLGNHRC